MSGFGLTSTAHRVAQIANDIIYLLLDSERYYFCFCNKHTAFPISIKNVNIICISQTTSMSVMTGSTLGMGLLSAGVLYNHVHWTGLWKGH